MAEIKRTQKALYEGIIARAKGENTEITVEEIVAFAEKKLEQLAHKTASGTSKKNEEHEAFMEIIRDVLSEKEKAKCGEILKDKRIASFSWKDGKETSSQRVSAILSKMVDKGDVVKATEKKDTFFSLA